MSKIPPRHPAKENGKPKVRPHVGRYLDRNPARPITESLERAVRDEPELIHKDYEDEFAKENNNRFSALRAKEERRREFQTLQGHLRGLCAEIERSGAETPPEFDTIRRLMESARQRLRIAA